MRRTEWFRFCRQPLRWEPNRFLSHMPTDITSEPCATPINKFTLCFPHENSPKCVSGQSGQCADQVSKGWAGFLIATAPADLGTTASYATPILVRLSAAARIRGRAPRQIRARPPPCNDGARRLLQRADTYVQPPFQNVSAMYFKICPSVPASETLLYPGWL
jgi:hypothetical protein